jgi:hypothetical protein
MNLGCAFAFETLLTAAETRAGTGRKIFFVMNVSGDAVAIPERKVWKNRRLASGIATRLLLALFNFLEGARRAKEKLRSMEQCFRAEAGKHRLLARVLFRDYPIQQRSRGEKTEMNRSKIQSQCLKRNAGKRREFGCGIQT